MWSFLINRSTLLVVQREVGTFIHRLPADLVVTKPEHRKIAEKFETTGRFDFR